MEGWSAGRKSPPKPQAAVESVFARGSSLLVLVDLSGKPSTNQHLSARHHISSLLCSTPYSVACFSQSFSFLPPLRLLRPFMPAICLHSLAKNMPENHIRLIISCSHFSLLLRERLSFWAFFPLPTLKIAV